MTFIIDRFEENFAVCEKEDMSFINIPLDQLPQNVSEGTKIKLENETYVIVDNTDDRNRIRNKMNLLFKK